MLKGCDVPFLSNVVMRALGAGPPRGVYISPLRIVLNGRGGLNITTTIFILPSSFVAPLAYSSRLYSLSQLTSSRIILTRQHVLQQQLHY